MPLALALSLAGGAALAAPDLTDRPSEPLGIYGGQEASKCAWPTAVAVAGNGSLCTGTLVHPRLVVYAAHCGDDPKTIDFGELTLAPGQFVKAELCMTNPSYGGVNDQAHDWAFCRLPYSITGVPVTPVLYGCEIPELNQGDQVAIVGFGANQGDAGAGTKRWAMTTLTGVFGNTATLGGNGKPSVCPGDSGGPAFLQLADGSWRAFGIASTVTGSCGGSGTHALIHKAVPWIEQNSGIDITPCHDDNGNWDPDFHCGGFYSASAGQGFGTWSKWCDGTPKGGASQTCGAPFDSVPDDMPPNVVIDDPQDGAHFDVGTPVTIAISATDNDGWGITGVRLRINGQEQKTVDIDEPYAFAGVMFPEGEWVLQAVAEDAAANIGESATVTIVVGNPQAGTSTSTGGGESTGASGSATDATTGSATDATTDASAGTSGGATSGVTSLGTSGATGPGFGDGGSEDEGCGCRSGGGQAAPLGLALVLLVAAGGRRRRA